MALVDVVRAYERWPSWAAERPQFDQVLSRFDELAGDEPGDDAGAGNPPATSEATCVEGRTGERRGEWREVLEQVDTAAVTEFTIAVGADARSRRGDLRLEFSRRHGVVLAASTQWFSLLEQSDEPLKRAIESGVPRFAWLRSQLSGAIFTIVFACLVEVAALLLLPSDDTVAIVAAFPIGFLIALGIWALLGRRFPRFRILPSSPQVPARGE